MPCNPGGRSPSGAGRCLNRRKGATYFCRHTKKCVLYHSKKFKVLTPLLIVQTLSTRTASLARQPAFKDSCLVEGLHQRWGDGDHSWASRGPGFWDGNLPGRRTLERHFPSAAWPSLRCKDRSHWSRAVWAAAEKKGGRRPHT